jgi:hypothetical protein
VSRLACITCIAASLALAACEQRSDAPPSPSSPPAAGTTQASAPQGDVPTEQDYEDEAEKDITAANMEGELDKLDKEIGQ